MPRTRVCMVQTSGSFSEHRSEKSRDGTSRTHFSSAAGFTGLTPILQKVQKNALAPEIQLRICRGPADLTYPPSQNQFPKHVTHLSREALSTVTTSHRGIQFVLPVTHPLLIPWSLWSWQQSWVRGSLIDFSCIGSKSESHISTVIWALLCNAKCPPPLISGTKNAQHFQEYAIKVTLPSCLAVNYIYVFIYENKQTTTTKKNKHTHTKRSSSSSCI